MGGEEKRAVGTGDVKGILDEDDDGVGLMSACRQKSEQ